MGISQIIGDLLAEMVDRLVERNKPSSTHPTRGFLIGRSDQRPVAFDSFDPQDEKVAARNRLAIIGERDVSVGENDPGSYLDIRVALCPSRWLGAGVLALCETSNIKERKRDEK